MEEAKHLYQITYSRDFNQYPYITLVPANSEEEAVDVLKQSKKVCKIFEVEIRY